MTKKQLIKALAEFPDNAPIMVFWSCDCGEYSIMEHIVDLNSNGPAVQLNSSSGRQSVGRAWQENLQQNAKVRARAEGLVSNKEWKSARKAAQ